VKDIAIVKLSRVYLIESTLVILLGWVSIASLALNLGFGNVVEYSSIALLAVVVLKRNLIGAYSQYLLAILISVAAIGTILPAMGVDYAYILRNISPLLTASVVTIYISLLSICLACVVSFIAALAKLSNRPVLCGIADVYISFFRGTPLLLQVFIVYLGLPQVGIVLTAIPAAVLALGLNYGAYMAEIVRAGIQGVPRGQSEASLSLGLTRSQTFLLVVLPQALRLILPPISNQFIAMLKDSSLVSFLGVWELMFVARTAGRTDFRQFEMLIGAALIYWLMSFCFEMAQRRLEKKLGQ
jgi:polar amino acid transport system permease protein